MKEKLGRDEAHLWLVRPEKIGDPGLLRSYQALLTDDEREKTNRFRFAKDRHLCLVTRALVRSVLSKYEDVPPDDWRFVVNQHGRPEIAKPEQTPPLRFNLSHTQGLVACLVARGRDTGVDVENRKRRGELLDVADRYFSAFEVAALGALPESERLDRFFIYWTLKESYIKARGMGLAIPLSQFSFDVDGDTRLGIRILIDPRLEDDCETWQFFLFSYLRQHVVAASLRRAPGKSLSLKLRETIPLRD